MSYVRRVVLTIGACLPVLLGLCFLARAVDVPDMEQGDIGAGDITHNGQRWGLRSNGTLFSWILRVRSVNTELKPEHVRSSGSESDPDEPENQPHRHFLTQDYKSAYDSGSVPKIAEVNRYWDFRFKRCDRTSPPTVLQTCHEYALTNSPKATGTYTYGFTADTALSIIGTDLRYLEVKSALVSANDILVYPARIHSTVVVTAPGNHPTKLRWKWQGSGIYEYNVPAGNEWDTPMCVNGTHTGDVETGKTPAEKEWIWDPDYAKDPKVYTESEPDE